MKARQEEGKVERKKANQGERKNGGTDNVSKNGKSGERKSTKTQENGKTRTEARAPEIRQREACAHHTHASHANSMSETTKLDKRKTP